MMTAHTNTNTIRKLTKLSGLAMMPLYDWPELHDHTDALWARIREAARAEGLDVPEALDHRPQRLSAWMAEEVVFSQLCGSPWFRKHRHHARYLATSDFDLMDNAPGTYFSQVVVKAGSDWTSLASLNAAKLAFNDDDSQSGVHCLRPLMAVEPLLAGGLETGGHRFSMQAVAAGEADFAAIDAFSFRLAERIMPEVIADLRVLTSTPARPAPVLITSKALGDDVGARMQRAVLAGWSTVPAEITSTYAMRGAVDLGGAVYSVFDLSKSAEKSTNALV